jgi:Flp pilus assembly protein TadD
MDLVQRAHELYSEGRMHDALEAAQAACDRAPKDAEAWRLLARVSRHVGLTAASDDAFRRAAALSPSCSLPYRVNPERFQELVREARESLPEKARERLRSTTVKLHPLPAVDDVRAGLDPDALTARKRQPQEALVLYQLNHENQSGTEVALRQLIGRSLRGA